MNIAPHATFFARGPLCPFVRPDDRRSWTLLDAKQRALHPWDHALTTELGSEWTKGLQAFRRGDTIQVSVQPWRLHYQYVRLALHLRLWAERGACVRIVIRDNLISSRLHGGPYAPGSPQLTGQTNFAKLLRALDVRGETTYAVWSNEIAAALDEPAFHAYLEHLNLPHVARMFAPTAAAAATHAPRVDLDEGAIPPYGDIHRGFGETLTTIADVYIAARSSTARRTFVLSARPRLPLVAYCARVLSKMGARAPAIVPMPWIPYLASLPAVAENGVQADTLEGECAQLTQESRELLQTHFARLYESVVGRTLRRDSNGIAGRLRAVLDDVYANFPRWTEEVQLAGQQSVALFKQMRSPVPGLVLEQLLARPEGLTKDELADRLSLDPSTAYRTLEMLHGFGVVTRHRVVDSRAIRYALPRTGVSLRLSPTVA